MAAMLRVRLPSWAPCVSPTPWSSAGTTRPAARRSRPSRWPGAWRRAPTSRWSASPAGTGGHRRRHGGRRSPSPSWRCSGPLLYEAWLRLRRPRVERVTGRVDVTHATGLVPCATAAPLVVTFHDVDFVHEPGRYSRQGATGDAPQPRRDPRHRPPRADARARPAAMTSRRPASTAPRIRVVPLGVDGAPADDRDVADVRRRYHLPERFALFVGTLEPRKNLHRLADGDARAWPIRCRSIVVGPDGWGRRPLDLDGDVRFLGFVPASDLPALYAAASVFAYPSEREGFGLPVAEAMAQGTPVVTSAGTSTEEVAGGRGGARRPARRRRHRRRARRRRAAQPPSWRRPAGPAPHELTWDATARRHRSRRVPRGRGLVAA